MLKLKSKNINLPFEYSNFCNNYNLNKYFYVILNCNNKKDVSFLILKNEMKM